MNQSLKKSHREFAVEFFNHTWDLMEQEERTAMETDEMIHSAHASRFHWGVIGEPLNWQRGEWQISRVYAIIGHAHASLYHAQRCMVLTEEYQLGGFDLAFAHEALARAFSLLGDNEMMERHIELGKIAAEAIQEQEDKDYTLGELGSINIE